MQKNKILKICKILAARKNQADWEIPAFTENQAGWEIPRFAKIRRIEKSLRLVKIRRIEKSLHLLKIRRIEKSLRLLKIRRTIESLRALKSPRLVKNPRLQKSWRNWKSRRPAYCLGSAESSAADFSFYGRPFPPPCQEMAQIHAATKSQTSAWNSANFCQITKFLTRLISILSLSRKNVPDHCWCPISAVILATSKLEAILKIYQGSCKLSKWGGAWEGGG